jgi:hypothetical protein
MQALDSPTQLDVALQREQNVIGFDISVDDSLGM